MQLRKRNIFLDTGSPSRSATSTGSPSRSATSTGGPSHSAGAPSRLAMVVPLAQLYLYQAGGSALALL